MYISIFSLQFPTPGTRTDYIFSGWKKKKERKEFLNLETTVVADFHLIK